MLRLQREIAAKRNADIPFSFHDEDVNRSIETLKTWYLDLVKASSLVFVFELLTETIGLLRLQNNRQIPRSSSNHHSSLHVGSTAFVSAPSLVPRPG
jgi:hypothetical protein